MKQILKLKGRDPTCEAHHETFLEKHGKPSRDHYSRDSIDWPFRRKAHILPQARGVNGVCAQSPWTRVIRYFTHHKQHIKMPLNITRVIYTKFTNGKHNGKVKLRLQINLTDFCQIKYTNLILKVFMKISICSVLGHYNQ